MTIDKHAGEQRRSTGHAVTVAQARDAAARAGELGDDGTDDLLISQVVRTGELQAWFLAEHLMDTPLVRA